MRTRLEGNLGATVVGDVHGVLIELTEVRQVEYHISDEHPMPEGWTLHDDGVVASGPMKYATGTVEVHCSADAAEMIANLILSGAAGAREMAAKAAADYAASLPPMPGNAANGPPTRDV